MFKSFENISYEYAQATGIIEKDFSLTGEAMRFDFSGTGSTVSLTFDSMNFNDFDELTLQLFMSDLHAADNVFRVTINDRAYDLPVQNSGYDYKHVAIDCSFLGDTECIIFESLTDELTVFVDALGVRRADVATIDLDVVDAVLSTLRKKQFRYGQRYTLATDAIAGDSSITLDTVDFLPEYARIQIDAEYSEVGEYLDAITGEVQLGKALDQDYPKGTPVEVLIPIESEDYGGIENDPVIGVVLTDMRHDTIPGMRSTLNSERPEKYLGDVIISVYIDCTCKAQVLSLARQYERHFADTITILLDGEKVYLYTSDQGRSDMTSLGNNPRMNYVYEVRPQPVLDEGAVDCDLTFKLESE